MQTHERWAVGAAIAAVASPILSAVLYAAAYGDPWTLSAWWETLFRLVGGLAANLVVGAWLWVVARRDGNSSIVWFTLGLVFSLLAAILYFLLRVLDRQSPGLPSA